MPNLFPSLSAPEEGGRDRDASKRPDLPKRFYQHAHAENAGGMWRVLVDGRLVKTPAKRPLEVASERIAAALAKEWQAQEKLIDPAAMPLTRLVNSALDGVADRIEEVVDAIAAYADSDLLYYRAEGPDRLVARQTALWDPVLTWAETEFGTRFHLAAGMMPVAQDPRTRAKIRAAMPTNPLTLAGLHSMTTVTGSVLLALAVFQKNLTVDEAWTAAHIDEDWNIAQWGVDAEAAASRAYRRAEMEAAALLIA